MLTTRLAAAAFALHLAAAASAAHGQTSSPAPAPAAPASAAAAVNADYRIGPDDQLEVNVYDVPELTRAVQVDARGRFILPLVGQVDAAGLTADQVAGVLTERLSGRYLKDPQITVMVKQAVSQRVTVNGAVVKPGVYPLSGPTTLIQAVALANGADPRSANLKKVAIFRNVDGQRRGQVFDLTKIQDGETPDPEVRADDIVVVDQSGTKSFFAYFGSALSFLTLVPW